MSTTIEPLPQTGPRPEETRSLPEIGGIEINDGTFTAPWSLFEDTINHRRLCGEGEFDVRGFVATMLEAGYRGPWGIEVLNEDLRQLPPDQIAPRAFATTRAQFPT